MTKCKRAVATDSCTNAINIKQDAQRMRNILPAGLQAWGAVHKWKLYSIVMIDNHKNIFFGKEEEYTIDVFFTIFTIFYQSDVNYGSPHSRPAWPTIKTMNVDCIEYFCSKTSIQCSQLRQAATAMPRPPPNRQTNNSALEKYKTLLFRDLL